MENNGNYITLTKTNTTRVEFPIKINEIIITFLLCILKGYFDYKIFVWLIINMI